MDHSEPPVISATLSARETFAFDDTPRLTAALKRGDEVAFTWLHRTWSGRINRYCFAVAAGDEAFANEIAQAAWLRLVKHVHPMKDEQALWNWIACAARHAASDLRRTGGRYLRVISRFAEWWHSTSSNSNTDAEYSVSAALEAALDKLPPDERGLIEDRYFVGESLETIGTRHGLTARAVEGRLARLRTRLRELIAKELQSLRP